MPRAKTPRRLSGRPPRHAGRLLARVLREGRLDGRSKVARLARDLENDLIADLGGEDHVSTAQKLLITRAVSTALICSAFENFVFQAESPVNKDGEPLSLLRSYVSHSQSLSRLLQTLGIRREALDRGVDLSTYISNHTKNATQDAERAHSADAAPTPAADSQPDPENPPQAAFARPTAISDED